MILDIDTSNIGAGFFWAVGAFGFMVITSLIGFYFNTRNTLKNLKDQDKEHDEQIKALETNIRNKASKDFAEGIKQDITRELSEVKQSIADLNKSILDIIKTIR